MDAQRRNGLEAIGRSDPLERAGAPEPSGRRFPDETAPEIVRTAETLGIPWQRLLREEIQAERTLRRHVPGADTDVPLPTSLSLLPSSFLNSWRARDQIQALSCEARGAAFRSAIRQLRTVFRLLAGQPDGRETLFAGHLWLAHERILLLQRVCRAARRSAGTSAERLEVVCAKTRCSFDDAAWALCLEGSPRPGHRLDAAVRKARDEGFELPHAPTEAKVFAKLRRIVQASSAPAPRRRAAPELRDRQSVPARIPLPTDAV